VNPSSVNFGGMNNKNDNDDDDNGQNSPLLAADRAYNDVLAEICHVLKGGETTDADYSERLSVISPEDMAVQAVFSLLDTLSTWSSKGLAARPRRPVYDRTVPQGGGSVSSTTNQTHESVDEDIFDIARKTGVVVRKLVEAVPKMLLASAALSIKAYARALRYLELHLREQPSLSERSDSSIGSTSDLLLRTVHDGSNGQLPPLGPTQIDTLMQIFSKLEAPDALQGLLVVAQKMGQRPSSTNRLLELEHSDDWLGALLEYGLISSPASASGGRGDRQVILQPNRATATPYAAIAGPSQFSAPTTIAPSGDMDVDEQQKKMTDPAGGGALDPEAQAAIHERGRLKCLMELGHLDAVVDQALGTIQRTPSLEPALAPLGVEASWRLMQWSDLSKWLGRIDAIDNQPEMSSLLLPEDAFNVSVGKLFLSLRLHEKKDFDFEMTEARRTIMQALSAASMESYRRAYPLLVRLQILQELEEGFTLITSKTVEEKTKLLTNKWFWEPRIESMSPSMTHRSFVLATRRTLLGASGLPHLVAENWVDLATRLSHLGRYEAARIALQYAGEAGLDVQECVLRESRLLKEAGHVHKALMLLEPVEPDFYRIGQLTKMPVIKALSDMTAATAVDSAQLKAAVDHLARTDSTCSLPPFLTCLENKIAFSERLLLGTQLVIDCRAKHGSQVIERYQCLVDLRPSWELAHFHLARYHEYLYHEFKRKDLQDLLAADTEGGKGRNTTQVNMTAKGKGVDHSRQEDYCSLMCSSLRHALKSYCKSIVNGSSATTLTQALPRMLTLWFSCTSPEFGFATARAAAAAAVASGKGSVGEKETQRSEKLALLKSSANKVIVRFKDSIEAHIWFACMPQLVSRTGHKNPETLSLVKDLVLRVLTSYPQQGVWHIAGLVHSLVPARKKIGEALITEACAELKRKTDTTYNQHLKLSTRTECAEMLLDAKKLFQNLVELAALQHKDRRLKWLWPCDINNIKRILVPNQHVLARAAPIVDTSRTRPAADTSASSDQGATFQYIQSFNDMVDVAASKAKPKTIYLTTTSGGAVKFLCKQEKNGDLRKDARMMEFNTVINRLLQHDLEGRRRNLRLRTYAVVCLNEECGILEWVGNTTCIRHLIRDSHQYYPQRFNNIDTKAVYHPFLEMQEKHQDDMAALVHQYQHLVLNKYQPCFHRWFIERFSDPTAWLESRLTFTRSCAIWAVVGHVVGLGDRHTENVLLDTTNGECVHVDFDCLFDKGLQLARPEIVPFRLTPNLVDAMGLTGVEGVFRRTMEVSMSLLRENKETLLSVLEPFLRDPTVAWGRGGRAQRQDVAQLPKGALNAAQKTTAEQSAVVEAENPEVKEALEKITGRLNGIYNLTNPAAERIHRRYLQKSQPLPAFGMGAGRDEAQSLSVQGQVARLIDEAKAVENLAQMYIGWTPWQ
jgi:serine/threonine-protein kinase ATR